MTGPFCCSDSKIIVGSKENDGNRMSWHQVIHFVGRAQGVMNAMR